VSEAGTTEGERQGASEVRGRGGGCVANRIGVCVWGGGGVPCSPRNAQSAGFGGAHVSETNKQTNRPASGLLFIAFASSEPKPAAWHRG
jgi:hypothetical protein